MATMYETIMNLPLFKGLSHEQISSFLEKTHIRFHKYSDRERIVEKGTRANSLKCVISGNIIVSRHIGRTNPMVISEVITGQYIIGADRLFGMNTEYDSDADALGNVSVMEFSKEQYFSLLSSGNILLINYLNTLSFSAQRVDIAYSCYPRMTPRNLFASLVALYTSKNARSIKINFCLEDMSDYTHIDISLLKSALLQMQEEGIIYLTKDGIEVKDRARLCEF